MVKNAKVSFSVQTLKIVDALVKDGFYTTRSAIVNEAVLQHLRTHYPGYVKKEGF